MSKPVVAIVGRPNVGKSTLFNVLAGSTISIVKDTPGVTRDRIYADCTWLNNNFTLIDTGGIEPDSKDIILAQMREQAQIAINTADVIIFIVDVRQGLVDADSKVADMLRKSKKPVVLAVNKVDSMAKFGNDVYEFYNLGIGDPVPVSAASRLGLGELLDDALIDGKVISVLNFARTLSPSLCQFPCREPGFIRTITIRVFTPPSVDCYILSIPLPSMAKGSVTPLICDMI